MIFLVLLVVVHVDFELNCARNLKVKNHKNNIQTTGTQAASGSGTESGGACSRSTHTKGPTIHVLERRCLHMTVNKKN
jgi:hypothetical protein